MLQQSLLLFFSFIILFIMCHHLIWLFFLMSSGGFMLMMNTQPLPYRFVFYAIARVCKLCGVKLMCGIPGKMVRNWLILASNLPSSREYGTDDFLFINFFLIFAFTLIIKTFTFLLIIFTNLLHGGGRAIPIECKIMKYKITF